MKNSAKVGGKRELASVRMKDSLKVGERCRFSRLGAERMKNSPKVRLDARDDLDKIENGYKVEGCFISLNLFLFFSELYQQAPS
ncbi:hypothetical protein GCM10008018_65330 [Paenibacillus marchantiophytorum]|uniref:Uncharacterized protein n=1 Tax=Paenibacillus marchantiophytorum TaxID=1619310 RepID=A0ABQ1FFR4_9BACL|nr:hypothetical protein GCM10008018_65330 [Paenibacillus marchantiophytorum]